MANKLYTPQLKLNWEAAKGHITVPHGFRNMDWIDQLDLLSDWLADLQELYDLINHHRSDYYIRKGVKNV